MSTDRSAEQELLVAHKRRLQTLEIQAARFGIDTPAHITIEIADLRNKIAVLEQRLKVASTDKSAVGQYRVWVVDHLHRGDHLTITLALAAASPGDRILIRPGVYDEALVIDKPVELIGEGEPGDVLVRANDASVVRFNCARGLVKNVTLRQIQGDSWAIHISQGRLDVEDCDISSVGNGSILITNSAYPRLRRNRIHDNQGNGVGITANAQGLLEDNDIFNNDAAVVIANGARPTLRKNRIHDNQGNGVGITANAQGLLEDNDIFNHNISAVYIANGARPTLRKNRIHDNQGNGVGITANAQGLLEDNDIFNNDAAVVIGSGARPTLRKNRIHDNQDIGVSIDTNAQGLLEDNDIFNNDAAVVIGNGARPTLRKNRIHDNQDIGVSIDTNAQGLLEDNDIFNNDAAVVIGSGARPTLRKNRIHQNKSNGIWIKGGGGGTFEYNTLYENKQGNWDIEHNCLQYVVRIGNSE